MDRLAMTTERYPAERVEQALAGHYNKRLCDSLRADDECVLAAEVRALREELEAERAKSALLAASLKRADAERDEDIRVNDNAHAEIERMQTSIDLYRATIARVEALCEGYEAAAREMSGGKIDAKALHELLASELREALAGEDSDG